MTLRKRLKWWMVFGCAMAPLYSLAGYVPGVEVGVGYGLATEGYALEGWAVGGKGGQNFDYSAGGATWRGLVRYFAEKHPYGAKLSAGRSTVEVSDIRGTIPQRFDSTRKHIKGQGYYFPLESNSSDWLRPLGFSVGYFFERKEVEDTRPRQVVTSYNMHGPSLGFLWANTVVAKWNLSAEVEVDRTFISSFNERQKHTGYFTGGFRQDHMAHLIYNVTDALDVRGGLEWVYEKRRFDDRGDRGTAGDPVERFSTVTFPVEIRYHF